MINRGLRLMISACSCFIYLALILPCIALIGGLNFKLAREFFTKYNFPHF